MARARLCECLIEMKSPMQQGKACCCSKFLIRSVPEFPEILVEWIAPSVSSITSATELLYQTQFNLINRWKYQSR